MTATIPDELLAILADPETHEPLTRATDAQLAALRDRLANGKARVRGGGEVPADFDAALLSQANRVAYLVLGGIPNMLVDDRIELDEPV